MVALLNGRSIFGNSRVMFWMVARTSSLLAKSKENLLFLLILWIECERVMTVLSSCQWLANANTKPLEAPVFRINLRFI